MNAIATDSPFTDEQVRTLIALAGAIIPASSTYDVPAADDPLIAADILATAKRYPDAVAAALELQDHVAIAKHGAKFAELDAAAKTNLMEGANQVGFFDDVEWDFDAAQIAGQRTTLAIIAQCYYRDDRVMRSLDMEPRSPFPEGFAVEEGDWSLLEPVRRRGKAYRDAPP